MTPHCPRSFLFAQADAVGAHGHRTTLLDVTTPPILFENDPVHGAPWDLPSLIIDWP